MDIWLRRGVPRMPCDGGEMLPSRVDVAIVGGGMTGILTAHALRERGIHAVVFEAEEVGHGGSGDAFGAITLDACILSRLLSRYGTEGGALYVQLMRDAIDSYSTLANRYSLRATPEERNAVLYTKRYDSLLSREADAARTVGLEVSLKRRTELPFPISSALSYPAAWLDATLFLLGMARQIPVFDGVRVARCGEHMIETTDGDVIEASAVVLASRTLPPTVPKVSLPPITFRHAHAVALEGEPPLRYMYESADGDGMRILSCGEETLLASYPTHESEIEAATRYYPMASRQYRYTLWDIETPDKLPLIGQILPSLPNLYVATAFGGHGLIHAMTASEVLSAAICHETHPAAWLFSPLRAVDTASLRRAEVAEEILPCSHDGCVYHYYPTQDERK